MGNVLWVLMLGRFEQEFETVLSPVQLRVVPHLLHAMGNTAYVDTQKQASLTLAVSHYIL